MPPAPAPSRPRRTAETATIVLPAALALVCLALLVLNIAGGMGFPSNAPVEQIQCLGISVDLAAAFIALAVRTGVLGFRPRGRFEGRPGVVGPFAVVAGILALVLLIAFVLMGLVPGIQNAAEGADQRYTYWAIAMFLLGFAWVAGLVFGASAFRPGRGIANNGIALAAVAVLVLVAAATVAASFAYGLGLTE